MLQTVYVSEQQADDVIMMLHYEGILKSMKPWDAEYFLYKGFFGNLKTGCDQEGYLLTFETNIDTDRLADIWERLNNMGILVY